MVSKLLFCNQWNRKQRESNWKPYLSEASKASPIGDVVDSSDHSCQAQICCGLLDHIDVTLFDGFWGSFFPLNPSTIPFVLFSHGVGGRVVSVDRHQMALLVVIHSQLFLCRGGQATVLAANSIFFCFLLVKNHWFAWSANQWPLVGETLFTVFGLKGTYDVLILLWFFSNGPRTGQL